jgi:hypothetical protein
MVEKTSDKIGLYFKDIQRSLSSLADMIMDITWLIRARCVQLLTLPVVLISTPQALWKNMQIIFYSGLNASESSLSKLRSPHRCGDK